MRPVQVDRDLKTDADCTPSDYVGTFEGVRGPVGELPGSHKRVTYRVTTEDEVGEVRTPADLHDSDVVSSEVETGFGVMHAPCIDLDLPVHVIESSTPGHSHLYIDHLLTWEQYVSLLTVLKEVGLVEDGYLRASVAREGTHLRLPWVRKPEGLQQVNPA